MPAPDARSLDELERIVKREFENTTVFAFTDAQVSLMLGALVAMSTGKDFGFKATEREAAGDLADRIAHHFIRANPPEERIA